jgi:ribose transport system ATP-binding protein
METILSLSNISKTFGGSKPFGGGKAIGGIRALDEAEFSLARGEIHALVGANGAGKSTLIKILSGAVKPDGDSGSIEVFGRPVVIDNPAKARALGISVVYQEFSLVNSLSVAENIHLGRLPAKNLVVDKAAMVARSRECLARLDVNVDPFARVSSLSVAQKQMVEVAKALSNDSQILILDEPTASLSAGEVEHLFKNLRRLREQGISIVYVSHRLEELPVLADRVTVFRDGRYIITLPIAEAPKPVIIRHMVGREVLSNRRPPRAGAGELLRAEGLCGRSGFNNVSFTLKQGEILGFAGLAGAGRTETARAIFGVDKLTSGQIYVEGKAAAIKTPRDAIAHGIAFVTENRKEEGLVLGLSILDNLTMAIFDKMSKFGVINHRIEKEESANSIRNMGIKCASATQRARALSGGNQQKVVIGKWLSTVPSILIMDEPTRGIDVGSKSQIYDLIHALADAGKGIILISSELSEILELSDRIVVFAMGTPTAELDPTKTTQDEILNFATVQNRAA